jgi:hypothetical protein
MQATRSMQIGRRKYSLLKQVQVHLIALSSKGIKAHKYIEARYGRSLSQLYKINTKNLTGLISDLRSLYPKTSEV